MVISRRTFAENLKEMHGIKKRHVKGVQSFCFWQLSMQILWRRRCSRVVDLKLPNRELKQPRRRRQQKPLKFAYLTMKNSIFARFARAFFIFWHFEDGLVLSMTWNDLFCIWVDDVSISWQMLIFVFLCPKRWFIFIPRIVRTHFSSIMTLSNWKMIAEPRSHIFRWSSRFLSTSCLLKLPTGWKTGASLWSQTLSVAIAIT